MGSTGTHEYSIPIHPTTSVVFIFLRPCSRTPYRATEIRSNIKVSKNPVLALCPKTTVRTCYFLSPSRCLWPDASAHVSDPIALPTVKTYFLQTFQIIHLCLLRSSLPAIHTGGTGRIMAPRLLSSTSCHFALLPLYSSFPQTTFFSSSLFFHE